jgi:hypothetical protein
MTRRPRRVEAVGVEELKDAVLRMIVERFGGRPLDVTTATQGLALAAFELNMAHIRTAHEQASKGVKWVGPDGRPAPIQTHKQAVRFMRTFGMRDKAK